MQEFAPNKESSTASLSGHWPSDEELAAYIDGTLGKVESQRIAEHLADCEECFAIYMGTLQFQTEEGNVVPFPPRKDKQDTRWWYRIAALLVIGAGLGGAYAYTNLLARPPALVTAELTAPVQGQTGLLEQFWLGRTERGGGGEEGPGVPVNEAAFQVGVQAVNLQVSLQAGDGDKATNSVAYILKALKGQYTGGLDEAYTKEITGAVVEGKPPRDLIPTASKLAQDARDILGPEDVDLGQWIEAGRLAAIAGESSFFENRANRAFLRRLLWRQKLGFDKEMKLDPGARQSLQDISSVLAKNDLSPSDYAKLQRDFESILRIYYPES
ncbi:MAG TPA: zf-HC2 domain-containing protein [Thermoanaerobaculia bacterium]|jgi:hypothetical protein|nr:zf-HC2 domain-containing protein [Thermoanaerobaculia bacterium]